MVSKNVWVEATIHPDSHPALDLGWGGVAEPLDKLHVTLAFTNYNAETLSMDFVMEELRPALMRATEELPALNQEEVKVGGAAVLAPGKGDFGVLLLQNHLLWSYNTAYSRVFTADGTLDLTYPGWLPHITLSEDVTNHGDIETLHSLARTVGVVKIESVWLRAGRVCVPL